MLRRALVAGFALVMTLAPSAGGPAVVDATNHGGGQVSARLPLRESDSLFWFGLGLFGVASYARTAFPRPVRIDPDSDSVTPPV